MNVSEKEDQVVNKHDQQSTRDQYQIKVLPSEAETHDFLWEVTNNKDEFVKFICEGVPLSSWFL